MVPLVLFPVHYSCHLVLTISIAFLVGNAAWLLPFSIWRYGSATLQNCKGHMVMLSHIFAPESYGSDLNLWSAGAYFHSQGFFNGHFWGKLKYNDGNRGFNK